MEKPLLDLTKFAFKKTQDAMHVEDSPREEKEVHAQGGAGEAEGCQPKCTNRSLSFPKTPSSFHAQLHNYPAAASMQGPASPQLPPK